MAILTQSLDTSFTPAAGDFTVQVTGGVCKLWRANSSGVQFAEVGPIDRTAVIVSNPVAGSVYQLRAVSGFPAVSADQ